MRAEYNRFSTDFESDGVLSDWETSSSENVRKGTILREKKKTSPSKKVKDNLFVPDDFGKLDIRVGRIFQIEYTPHVKKNRKPCYKAFVEVREDFTRVVASELNYFYKEDDLRDRMVVVLCNVKARTRWSLWTDAWIISARNEEGTLELLDPPPDCEEGEQVTVEGFPTIPDIRDQRIERTWLVKRVLREVRVSEGKVAEYRRIPLKVEGRGVVTTQSLADCMVTDSFRKFRY